MSGEAMTEFVSDIKENGLLHPIILYQGMILDGRHRQEACDIAEIPARYEEYTGDDPIGFVISANFARRHLTVGEKAKLWINLCKSQQTGVKKACSNSYTAPPTDAIGAKKLGISRDSIAILRKVEAASPELSEEVGKGKVSINAAEKQINAQTRRESGVLDETKFKVPEDLIPKFESRSELSKILSYLSTLKRHVIEDQDKKDVLYTGLNHPATAMAVEALRSYLKEALAHAVCTSCSGRAKAKCSHCHARGWLNKQQYNNVPEEIRKMREK